MDYKGVLVIDLIFGLVSFKIEEYGDYNEIWTGELWTILPCDTI